MTTSSKTNKQKKEIEQPKSLEGVKKEFDKKFKKDLACDNPWKYAHPYLWDFISQQISIAEDVGYERGARMQVLLDAKELKEAEEREREKIIEKLVEIKKIAGLCLDASNSQLENMRCQNLIERIVTLLDSLSQKSTKQ